MVEYCHALLSFERAGGEQPTAKHFEVGLKLFVWMVATPAWGVVTNNPHGWRFAGSSGESSGGTACCSGGVGDRIFVLTKGRRGGGGVRWGRGLGLLPGIIFLERVTLLGVGARHVSNALGTLAAEASRERNAQQRSATTVKQL